MTAPVPETPPPLDDRALDERARSAYAWRVLSVTGIGTVLAFFDGSALTVALPAIGRHFGVGSDGVGWLVLAYLLALTAFILMFGRLADRLGRRRLYLLGMLLITIASAAGAFAPSIGFMVAMRAVQGVGGAAILANTTALIAESFPHRILPVGLSLNLTVVSIANLLAPLVSGALVMGLSWRAVFLIPAAIGVVGMLWASRALRRDDDRPRGPRRVRPAAPLLSAACLAGLAYACDQGASAGWGSTRVIVATIVAAVTATAFVVAERVSDEPLIDLELFRVRARTIAFATATTMIVSNSSLALLVSLYLQSVRGLDAWEAGVGITPGAIGVVATSSVAGLLARRIPTRVLSTIGLAMIACADSWLALSLDVDTSRVALSAALLASGIGMGLFQGPNTASLMSTVPPRLRSIASAVRSTIQCTAQVAGVALALTLVTAAAPGNRQSLVADAVDEAQRHALVGGFHHALLAMAMVAWAGSLVSLVRGSTPARPTYLEEPLPTAAEIGSGADQR